nr:endoribonuclease Dicer homolog 2-like [Tanacetum cinerariifolium]
MRDASLSHAAEPCEPPNSAIFNEPIYRVESTGACLSLSSSISMVYFYCSRLPSDGYFKPYPTFVIDKEARTCYINFPKNCPLPSVHVECNPKMLKQLASFTACIELHKLGALTDNLVPDTVETAGDAKEIAYDFVFLVDGTTFFHCSTNASSPVDVENGRRVEAAEKKLVEYEHQKRAGDSRLPRILGMTASPVKAKEADSSVANDFFTWGKQDARGETVAREFCKDANDIFSSYIPAVQSQSRGKQNKIVDEFREGKVNIIVATSILEEGLDVQSCNLVIRFDLSSTVCSFIQSREFLLLIRSGDVETQDKVNNYLISGQIMRDESLSHAAEPCEPPNSAIFNQPVYRVESTGASLSLSSSISMVYFYRSRLPSDGFVLNYLAFNAIMYTLV